MDVRHRTQLLTLCARSHRSVHVGFHRLCQNILIRWFPSLILPPLHHGHGRGGRKEMQLSFSSQHTLCLFAFQNFLLCVSSALVQPSHSDLHCCGSPTLDPVSHFFIMNLKSQNLFGYTCFRKPFIGMLCLRSTPANANSYALVQCISSTPPHLHIHV